jgi:hypothetical protein
VEAGPLPVPSRVSLLSKRGIDRQPWVKNNFEAIEIFFTFYGSLFTRYRLR